MTSYYFFVKDVHVYYGTSLQKVTALMKRINPTTHISQTCYPATYGWAHRVR